MKKISKDILNNALTYSSYRELVSGLYAQQKTTSDDNGEAMLEYTKINIARMNRLDRTTRLSEASISTLVKITTPQTWLVLTEGWCGDAAQILPVMQQMASATPNIEFKLILRDEHPDIMDAFLTNGTRSIPKLIILDSETREVLGSWGPRPAEVQKMMMDVRRKIEQIDCPEERLALNQQLKIDVQKWYNSDKTVRIQAEILEVVEQALTYSVNAA